MCVCGVVMCVVWWCVWCGGGGPAVSNQLSAHKKTRVDRMAPANVKLSPTALALFALFSLSDHNADTGALAIFSICGVIVLISTIICALDTDL